MLNLNTNIFKELLVIEPKTLKNFDYSTEIIN